MAIKAGTVNDFGNSMAHAMENAMKAEYQILKGEAMPAMGQEDRRMLLCAIAQGVVRYLKDNLDAFEIDGDITGGVADLDLQNLEITGMTTTGTLHP